MTRSIPFRAAAASAALFAAAGQAQPFDTTWMVDFSIDSGALAGQSFSGVLEYDQATLLASFTDGLLFADMGEFDFSVTLPNGVILDLNDDPAAFALFGGNELIGLNYLGDNFLEALNTSDLLIDVTNTFRLFLDADAIADGAGSFTFTRLTETDAVTIYRNGANSDIDDTQVRLRPTVAGSGDENFEGGLELSVDADDGPGSVNPSQILIRFNDVIGNGANQVPPGSTIVGAVFRVELTSPGSGFTAHRMLVDWDPATVTWNSLGNGVVADDVVAVSTPDFSITGVGIGDGILGIDLTASLQAFADGAPNYGFALLPLTGGTDGVDFFSTEATVGVAQRFFPPLLTVQLGDGTTLTFQEGENGYVGTADTTLRQEDPDITFGALNTTSIDLSDGGFITQYLLRYDGIFGTGANQIDPATDTVVSATILVRSTSPGEDVAVHELIKPFDETRETWNTFDTGVTADDIEAELTPVTVISTTNDAANPAYSTDGSSNFITFDVTSSLQGFVADTSSYQGWAFLPLSTNGFDFDAEGILRLPIGPQLYVSFVPPSCRADITGDGTLDIFDILGFFDLFGSASPDADFTGEGTLDIFDILGFFDEFGLGC